MGKADSIKANSNGALTRINVVLTRVLESLAILAMGILVMDVVWGVVTRYLMGAQAEWTEELARFLLIWVALLGGALAFRQREHLGIDFLVGSMTADVNQNMRRFKQVIICLTAALVFLYGGSRVVFDALAAEQTTPALGWKMGYVYSCVPIAGVFILMFAMEELFSVGDNDIVGKEKKAILTEETP